MKFLQIGRNRFISNVIEKRELLYIYCCQFLIKIKNNILLNLKKVLIVTLKKLNHKDVRFQCSCNEMTLNNFFIPLVLILRRSVSSRKNYVNGTSVLFV